MLLADFSLASEPGNDRLAADRVANAIEGHGLRLGVSSRRLENLRTAVAEATLNAIEHGNHFAPDKTVGVRVVASDEEICVTVSDLGGDASGERTHAAVAPDLDAKLRGQQSPRGWGLFLIRNMVDECTDETEGQVHRVHLRLRLD